jgi:hypothetical protein
MTDWVEIERTNTDEFLDAYCIDVPCRGGCGQAITLYWNGGELDCKECCGYRYALEHVRTDLVISKEEPPR